jgi:hypothetical protein
MSKAEDERATNDPATPISVTELESLGVEMTSSGMLVPFLWRRDISERGKRCEKRLRGRKKARLSTGFLLN